MRMHIVAAAKSLPKLAGKRLRLFGSCFSADCSIAVACILIM